MKLFAMPTCQVQAGGDGSSGTDLNGHIVEGIPARRM
jgi:hypothetical protein